MSCVDTSSNTSIMFQKSVIGCCSFGSCGKKLGLIPYTCRCKHNYCQKHRMPEQHDCKFDYKTMGKNLLEKNNEKVVADKVANRI